MDPNPKRFPILSFVMSRINSHLPLIGQRTVRSLSSSEIDIEQPPDREEERGLLERMPHLNESKLLASMANAISDVVHTRSVLQTLGPRPDHDAVDSARAKIAEIESRLDEEISADDAEMEVERRKEASLYTMVVQLDEMHEAYEKLLRDAEERLVKMHGSAEASAAAGEWVQEGAAGAESEEEVNEAIVAVLQEAISGKELERVELSGRELRLLPEAVGRIRGLVSLILSNNQLKAIPDSIAGLDQLAELNLSSNLLLTLPDSIGLLLNLKILNVSGNKLKALPDSISRCRSLVELDVSFNDLTYLPTNIGYELVKLKRFSLHLNKIRSLPTSICEMKSLVYLDAHFNVLHGLPYAIGRLTNLEVLNVSSNFSDLTELPETIGDLTNLKELYLSNNQIHALPVTVRRLDKLTKLNLDQNPLVIPPLEVVYRGVEAIKEYMARRWLQILAEEEHERILEADKQSQTGWLARSTSWVNKWVAGVSKSIPVDLGTGAISQRNSYLDQQL